MRGTRVAALTTLQAERTRYRNRIHSLLALHGVRRLRLDAQFAERLATVRDWAGAPLPPGVQARLLETWRLLQGVGGGAAAGAAHWNGSRSARTATAARTAAQRLGAACAGSRRGVRRCSPMELFSRESAQSARSRRAHRAWSRRRIGVGRSRWDQGVAPSGLPAVRRVAVEIAWAWLRYQPTSALTQWYHAPLWRAAAR